MDRQLLEPSQMDGGPLGAVRPGGGFVVGGAAGEAAVEDAYKAVRDMP